MPVLALGLAGALLTALALVQAVLLGLALATSGAAYGLMLAVDDPPLDVRAAGVAAGLLIVGELVGWSRELCDDDARRAGRRVAAARCGSPRSGSARCSSAGPSSRLVDRARRRGAAPSRRSARRAAACRAAPSPARGGSRRIGAGVRATWRPSGGLSGR